MLESFPAGTYYIGDSCYVLDKEIYHKLWGEKKEYKEGTIDVNGARMATVKAQSGGYMYADNHGDMYCVDSGTLSIVPIHLCTKCSFDEAKELGKIQMFKADVFFHVADGVINITDGHTTIIIDTNTAEASSGDEEEETETDEEPVVEPSSPSPVVESSPAPVATPVATPAQALLSLNNNVLADAMEALILAYRN